MDMDDVKNPKREKEKEDERYHPHRESLTSTAFPLHMDAGRGGSTKAL
jgi:hypothetical protein